MPYRNEKEALSARAAELRKSLEQLRSSRETLADEEQKVADEAASVARRMADLDSNGVPGLLDRVRVASPCSAKWDEMVGDERERFCLSCDKQVFNISAMSRPDAEAFLAARVAEKTCIRFFRRADGTILTEDCPTGVRKKRLRVIGAVAVGGGALMAAGAALFGATRHTMGEIAPPRVASAATTATPAPTAPPGWSERAGGIVHECMGDCAYDPTPVVQEHRLGPPPAAPAPLSGPDQDRKE
jgi:hypothetical protein